MASGRTLAMISCGNMHCNTYEYFFFNVILCLRTYESIFFFPPPIPLPSNISCINSFSYNLSVLSYKIPKGMTHLEELSFGKKLTFWQTLLAYFKLWKECFQHVRQSLGLFLSLFGSHLVKRMCGWKFTREWT